MSIDLGDTVPLGVDIVDAAGAPLTPGGVVLSIELPDGTSITPTPGPGESAGRYEYDFVPTLAGRHVVRWTSTEPATAWVDVLDVRPAAPLYLISLADAKAHLNITTSRHDEELRSHIEAATGAIERYLGEAVVRRSVTETVQTTRRGFALSSWPVISLTSAVDADGSAVDLDAAQASDVGIIAVSGLSGALTVTYVAGRAQIPPAYAHAARLVVAQLYGPQRAPGAGPPASPGGTEELTPDEYGVVIPAAARELLGVTGPLVA